MSLAAIIASLAVAVAVALLRALPRLLHDPALARAFPLDGDQGDAMSHLMMIDIVHRHGSGIPRWDEQFVLGRRLDYPLLFHWLMAWLPRAAVEHYDWTFSPLIEGIHAFCMFLFATWFLTGIGEPHPAAWAAIATLIATSTPILARAWRRAGVIGERSFGFLFADLYLMALVLFLQTPRWQFLAAAVVCFAITAASSKFGLQAAVFISAAMALLLLDWRPLAALVVSFSSAIVLSRGYVWFLLQGHIRHSTLYRSRLVHISDATSAYSWHDLREAAAAIAKGRLRTARSRLMRHPLGRLPVQLPWIAPFLLVLLQPLFGEPEMAAPLRYVVALALAALAVGILTSTDRLKFLGEGERYFEYAAQPCVLAVLMLAPALGGHWWLLLAAVGVWRYVRELRQPALFRGPTAAAAAFAERMRALPPGLILAIPGRLALPACYRTAHRAVWNIAHIEPGEATSDWLGLFPPGSHYPFPHPSALPPTIAKYRPDYLVLWRSGAAVTEEYCSFRYDFTDYPVLFDNVDYAVFDAAAANDSRLAAAQ